MTTSSKKSKPGRLKATKTLSKQPDNSPTFESLDVKVDTPSDQQIARLQQDLATQKDGRLEERFMWIFISIMLLDTTVASSVPPAFWAFLGPLQIIFLIVAADKCGMDDAKVILAHLYAKLTGTKKPDG